jgi:hypothetical protein
MNHQRAHPPQPSNTSLNHQRSRFEQFHDHAIVQCEINKLFRGVELEDACFWITCGKRTKNVDEIALPQHTNFVRRSLLGWADSDEHETENDVAAGKSLLSVRCVRSRTLPLFSISITI